MRWVSHLHLTGFVRIRLDRKDRAGMAVGLAEPFGVDEVEDRVAPRARRSFAWFRRATAYFGSCVDG
jgi:hypothetical protein